MYCAVNKNVIAIVPKIGTGNAPATSCSSQAPVASNAAKPTFSSVLEQAKPSANDSAGAQSDTTHVNGQGSYSSVIGQSKRDAKTSDSRTSDSKPSDSKTNDSQGHRNAPTQTPTSGPEPQALPLVVVQPQPIPVLCWNSGTKDFMFNTALGSAVANEKGVSSAPSAMNPTAGPGTDGLLTSLVKSQGNSSGQTSPNPNAAEPANAGPTKANSTSTEAPASVTANSPGAVASDSKTQPGVPLPVRNAPHSTAEAINQAQAVVRSEIEQIAIPPSIAPAVPSTPAPAQLETGSLQRTSTNLGPDKSGISSTQDSSGTTRKSSDVTGTTKPQSRKDDASSSFSSPGDDQSPVSVPVRTSDPSAAFSVTGIQPSTSTSSDKSVVPGVPSGSGEPQSGQLDQKSTGVAQTPPQGEAY